MSIKNKTEETVTSGQFNAEQPAVISMEFNMAESWRRSATKSCH